MTQQLWPDDDCEQVDYDEIVSDADSFFCILCDESIPIWVGENDPLPNHCPICGTAF